MPAYVYVRGSETAVQSSSISVHVTYKHDSILLWRRCDKLCTSSFMDDLKFAHNGQK